MRLHIFNCETEMALGFGGDSYTPPKRIRTLRRSLSLTPALYAGPGDAILILDDIAPEEIPSLKHYDDAKSKGLWIVTVDDLRNPSIRQTLSGSTVEPWGWNAQIRSFILKTMPWLKGIPSESRITALRQLAHRRTTILFHSVIRDMLSTARPDSLFLSEIKTPVEFSEPDKFAEWARNNTGVLKLPWSSSGRGVLFTDGTPTEKVIQWGLGAIKSQGRVIAEYAYDRTLDFATEWECRGGEVLFCGYSVFETDEGGHYIRNVIASQEELRKVIADAAPEVDEDFIEIVKSAIERVIAPHYDGPLGIDMLATEEGTINPCVEINLRHTMGIAAIR